MDKRSGPCDVLVDGMPGAQQRQRRYPERAPKGIRLGEVLALLVTNAARSAHGSHHVPGQLG